MWLSRFDLQTRIRAAGFIGICVLGGFFLNVLTKGLYGGSLVDPKGGVPPIMGLDANLVVFTPMLVLIIAGIFLSYRDNAE